MIPSEIIVDPESHLWENAGVAEKDTDSTRWLTARQVAALKGWKLDTVRRKMQKGEFGETKRIGPVTLIDRRSLAGVTVRPYNRAAADSEDEGEK